MSSLRKLSCSGELVPEGMDGHRSLRVSSRPPGLLQSVTEDGGSGFVAAADTVQGVMEGSAAPRNGVHDGANRGQTGGLGKKRVTKASGYAVGRVGTAGTRQGAGLGTSTVAGNDRPGAGAAAGHQGCASWTWAGQWGQQASRALQLSIGGSFFRLCFPFLPVAERLCLEVDSPERTEREASQKAKACGMRRAPLAGIQGDCTRLNIPKTDHAYAGGKGSL